jgi:hypothetical protein
MYLNHGGCTAQAHTPTVSLYFTPLFPSSGNYFLSGSLALYQSRPWSVVVASLREQVRSIPSPLLSSLTTLPCACLAFRRHVSIIAQALERGCAAMYDYLVLRTRQTDLYPGRLLLASRVEVSSSSYGSFS